MNRLYDKVTRREGMLRAFLLCLNDGGTIVHVELGKEPTSFDEALSSSKTENNGQQRTSDTIVIKKRYLPQLLSEMIGRDYCSKTKQRSGHSETIMGPYN